ncbi:MAG: hypothetical protein U5L96_14110 [Owenweeksia sp.]|nr:hypothetical protein [Owenweeksia sp.]
MKMFTNDPIDPQPALYNDVKHNNNITMKNVAIYEASYFVEENRVPIYVGGGDHEGMYDVNFNHPAGYSGSPLYEEAEITVKLDEQIWNKWNAAGQLGTDVEIVDEGERLLLITGANANIRSLNYDEGERDIIEIAVNFLMEEATQGLTVQAAEERN